MTKPNTSPESVAKRKRLAAALKINLAKRKALAKQQAEAGFPGYPAAADDKIAADAKKPAADPD